MGSLTPIAAMIFGVIIYIFLIGLAVSVVLSIKRSAKSQAEIAATNKEIAKYLKDIAAELARKNT